MFRLNTVLEGKLRNSFGDEFTNQTTGEVIDFKQLQIEMKDEKGRIAIENVSVPKKFWEENQIKIITGLIEQDIIIPVTVTGQKTGALKLTLNDLPKSQKMARSATA